MPHTRAGSARRILTPCPPPATWLMILRITGDFDDGGNPGGGNAPAVPAAARGGPSVHALGREQLRHRPAPVRPAGRGRRLSEHSFTGFRETLGPEHPYTLSAATTHANDLSARGDQAAATELLEATYASFKRVLGPYAPLHALLRGQPGAGPAGHGPAEDAIRLAEATMDRYAEALGPTHPEAVSGTCARARSECSTDAPYT